MTNSLVSLEELDLERLEYWLYKIKQEIERRKTKMKCPYCDTPLNKEEMTYCPGCGVKIEWELYE